MKFLQKDETLCIQCHICEETCAQTFFKSGDREKSSIKIYDKPGEKGEVINVCSQCGECIGICPELAIYRAKNGVVMIDKEKCVGCLMCVGFCPTLSMRIHKEFLEPFKCIACGQCAKQCPTKAIELKNID